MGGGGGVIPKSLILLATKMYWVKLLSNEVYSFRPVGMGGQDFNTLRGLIA